MGVWVLGVELRPTKIAEMLFALGTCHLASGSATLWSGNCQTCMITTHGFLNLNVAPRTQSCTLIEPKVIFLVFLIFIDELLK